MLLAQAMTAKQIEQLAKVLAAGFTELSTQLQRLDMTHIGIADVDPLDTPAGLLSAAQEAVEHAQLIGANRYYFREKGCPAKNTAAWKTLVFDIIDKREYSLTLRNPMVDFKSAAVLMEDAIARAYDRRH